MCGYRLRSTSSGGERRWRPVVLRTASTPRHTTVDTDEASSRNEVPSSAPRVSEELFLDQPASTSSSSRDESLGPDLDIGTGREAEGDSLRVSAAWFCTSSSFAESSGEPVGDVDCSRSWNDWESVLTTSPLQIGHVLRRVTSQGVLQSQIDRMDGVM